MDLDFKLCVLLEVPRRGSRQSFQLAGRICWLMPCMILGVSKNHFQQRQNLKNDYQCPLAQLPRSLSLSLPILVNHIRTDMEFLRTRNLISTET